MVLRIGEYPFRYALPERNRGAPVARTIHANSPSPERITNTIPFHGPTLRASELRALLGPMDYWALRSQLVHDLR